MQERKEKIEQKRLNGNKFQLKRTSGQVQRKVEIIENGIQVIVTCDNTGVVERLQKRVK